MMPIPEGSESHSEDCEKTGYEDVPGMLDQPDGLTGSGHSREEEQERDREKALGKMEGACELGP